MVSGIDGLSYKQYAPHESDLYNLTKRPFPTISKLFPSKVIFNNTYDFC